uniref:Uncharacterized protein n=1 Tax=uncultured Alphaproteobacteria bacterium TaxID=91750 RepID=A0A6G8F2B8_9PROT|nr:hypothetical protein PlAlph_3570 [uncultured Alphaproteobacteria bacterium]
MINNSSSDKKYKVFGDNSLIKRVNEFLFFNGYLSGSITHNSSNHYIKMQLFVDLEEKHHNNFLQELPLDNIEIEPYDYGILFRAEFKSMSDINAFFCKLCNAYDALFDLIVEMDNEQDLLIEGTATIGNHQWRIHKTDVDDLWPFPLHAHCHSEVLDPFTGYVYFCHDRKKIIRKISKRNLRLIQDRIRRNKDYGGLFDQYLHSHFNNS